MNWKELTSFSQIEEIISASSEKPVLIFKHSTRCSISSAALDRLQRKWEEELSARVDTYFLDLIQYREVSRQVAGKLGVDHQSPQVILIREGKAIYQASHFSIDYKEIKSMIMAGALAD